MIPRRIRTIIITSLALAIALSAPPVRSQNAPDAAKESPAATKPKPPGPDPDPKAAVTTKDPTVPVEELELLVKPLTVQELQNEAAGWLLLLKAKSQEISNAEIAIKRQLQSINKQKEASDAITKAKDSLKTAEESLSKAAPGSPEYEAANKKVEEAKENLKKAQSAVEQAKDAKKDLQKDKSLQEAVNKAKKSDALETAKKALETLKKDREAVAAGSQPYQEATKKIDTLEKAIKSVEDAKNAEKEAKPNTPEFKKASEKIAQTEQELKKILETVEGKTAPPDTTKKSAEELKKAEKVVDSTKLEGDKPSQSPNIANEKEKLQDKGKKLEKASEQLDKNAESEAKLKNQLVANVTELQSDRTAIVDRFKAVLTELERKGGDPKPYQQYIESVSIVIVDAKDTQGVGVRLLSWLKSGEGGLRWASNIGKFVGIVLVSAIVSQILGAIVYGSSKKIGGTSELLRQFIVMVIKRGGIVVGVLIALTALEVSLGPILALLGGASFVLAFALQSNLGNFASGLMIMFNKPFDVGDEVKVSGVWGYIDSITLANTKIKGFQGHMFTIPNNVVWEGTIENLTHSQKRKVVIWLRVAFDQGLERVEKILLETIKSHPKILSEPAPATVPWAVEDYYLSVGVNGWTKTEDFWPVYMDVIRMLQDRLNKEGIGVAAIPAQTLLFSDESPLVSQRISNGDVPSLPGEKAQNLLQGAIASEGSADN